MVFDALLLLGIVVATLLTADAFFWIPIDWTDGTDGLERVSDRASRLPARRYGQGGEAAEGQGGGFLPSEARASLRQRSSQP